MNALARLLTRGPAPRHEEASIPPGFALRGAVWPGADDDFVRIEVKKALQRREGLQGAGIHVSTSRGVVQLSGFVASRRTMAEAVDAIRSIPGVKSVRNDMRVA